MYLWNEESFPHLPNSHTKFTTFMSPKIFIYLLTHMHGVVNVMNIFWNRAEVKLGIFLRRLGSGFIWIFERGLIDRFFGGILLLNSSMTPLDALDIFLNALDTPQTSWIPVERRGHSLSIFETIWILLNTPWMTWIPLNSWNTLTKFHDCSPIPYDPLNTLLTEQHYKKFQNAWSLSS